ncbi:12049_t:CDS:1, partial [Dentiscutata heterogama]
IKQEDQTSCSKLSILQSCILSDENQNMEIIAKPTIKSINNNMQIDEQLPSRKRNYIEQKKITDITKVRPEIKKEILIKKKLGTLDYRVLESLEKDKESADKHLISKSNKKAKKYKDIYNSC